MSKPTHARISSQTMTQSVKREGICALYIRKHSRFLFRAFLAYAHASVTQYILAPCCNSELYEGSETVPIPLGTISKGGGAIWGAKGGPVGTSLKRSSMTGGPRDRERERPGPLMRPPTLILLVGRDGREREGAADQYWRKRVRGGRQTSTYEATETGNPRGKQRRGGERRRRFVAPPFCRNRSVQISPERSASRKQRLWTGEQTMRGNWKEGPLLGVSKSV